MRRSRSLVAATAASLVVVASLALPASALIKDPRRPVPIVLDVSQLQGPCDLDAAGTVCAFWYGNGTFATGDTNFSFLELDTWGQRKLRPCTHAGYGVMSDYMAHGFPDRLALHERRPTYACSRTGAATVFWQELLTLMNADRSWFFPVNDCSEQVSSAGDLVPCGSGTPEKFSIVGFARFRILAVYKGNDPSAIGSPGPPPTPGACGLRASDPDAVCLVMQAR